MTGDPTVGALGVVEASGAGGSQTLAITPPAYTASAVDGASTSISYTLEMSGSDVTGLKTTDGNHDIKLVSDSPTQISGMYDGDGNGSLESTAFTVAVVNGNQVKLTSNVALEHANDPQNTEVNTLNLGTLINVKATVTVTDGDNDQIVDSTSAVSALSLSFTDTDPTLTAVTNGVIDNEDGLILNGTIDSFGIDGIATYDLTGSIAPSGLTYDFTVPGEITAYDALDEEVFILSTNPATGTYTFNLVKAQPEVLAASPPFDLVKIVDNGDHVQTSGAIPIFAAYDPVTGAGIGDPLATVTFSTDSGGLWQSNDGLGIDDNLINDAGPHDPADELKMTFDRDVSDASITIGNFSTGDVLKWTAYAADGVTVVASGTINTAQNELYSRGTNLFDATPDTTVELAGSENIDYVFKLSDNDFGSNSLLESESFRSVVITSDDNAYKFIGFSAKVSVAVDELSLDFSIAAVDGDGDKSDPATFSVVIDGFGSILDGSPGNDVLVGGTGSDTFVWNFGDESSNPGTPAADTVQDFTAGDVVDLEDMLTGLASSDPVSDFVIVTQESDGFMIHVTDGSGTGSENDVQTILLQGFTTSDTATDILNDLIASQKYTGV